MVLPNRGTLGVILILMIAGCSGMPTPLGENVESVDCSEPRPFSDHDVGSIIPDAPSGWNKIFQEGQKVGETNRDFIFRIDGGKENATSYADAFYENSNGVGFYYLVTRWSSQNQAASSDLRSLDSSFTIINKTRIQVYGNQTSGRQLLLNSTSCVSGQMLTHYNVTDSLGEFSINESDVAFSNATISNVEAEMGSSTVSTWLNVTVSGEFENATLTATIEESNDTTIFSSEELSDGTATSRIYLSDEVVANPGTYTLNVSAWFDEANVIQEVDIRGVDASLRDIRVAAEDRQFGGPRLTELSIQVKNTGDVPLHVSQINVTVNGEVHPMLVFEQIPPEDTLAITDGESKIFVTNLQEGHNNLELQVIAGETIVASRNTSLTV